MALKTSQVFTSTLAQTAQREENKFIKCCTLWFLCLQSKFFSSCLFLTCFKLSQCPLHIHIVPLSSFEGLEHRSCFHILLLNENLLHISKDNATRSDFTVYIKAYSEVEWWFWLFNFVLRKYCLFLAKVIKPYPTNISCKFSQSHITVLNHTVAASWSFSTQKHILDIVSVSIFNLVSVYCQF